MNALPTPSNVPMAGTPVPQKRGFLTLLGQAMPLPVSGDQVENKNIINRGGSLVHQESMTPSSMLKRIITFGGRKDATTPPPLTNQVEEIKKVDS